MQGDHWRVAARCHVGLPALGVKPGDVCGMCGRRWDHGVSGCSLSRAAIHPSICSKGQFKGYRHDDVCDVLLEMYKAIGGTGVADHKKHMNTANTATIGSVCTLESGNRVDVVLFGAGSGGQDLAIDVSFVCAEAYPQLGFKAAIEKREKEKVKIYEQECKEANIEFHPFVLGAHGGFGQSAKALWGKLIKKATEIQGRDWRHSWTASSYSSAWLQKLSIALAKQTAIGTLRRTALCTRQRVMGGRIGVESGVYECVATGRVGFER